MFSHAFQGGGLGVEIFSSSGKDPAKLWKCTRNVHRVYDRTVKGFVFLLEKGTATQMNIPPEPSRELLGLVQPVLVLQLRLSPSKHTSLEVIILDDKGNKRRMHLSSTFREFECNDLHIQIPLRFEKEDRWVNLVLDLDEIIGNCFRGHKVQNIMYICIKPVCRVRKVFTLFQADRSARISIPAMYEFPTGTNYTNIYCPERSEPLKEWTPTVQELVLPPPPSCKPEATLSAAMPGPESMNPSNIIPPRVVEMPLAAANPAPVDRPPPSPSEAEKASRALKLLKRAKEDKATTNMASITHTAVKNNVESGTPDNGGGEMGVITEHAEEPSQSLSADRSEMDSARSYPIAELAPLTDDTTNLPDFPSEEPVVPWNVSNNMVLEVTGHEETVGRSPGQDDLTSPLTLQPPPSVGSKTSMTDKYSSTRPPLTSLLREVRANYTTESRPPTPPSTELAKHSFGEPALAQAHSRSESFNNIDTGDVVVDTAIKDDTESVLTLRPPPSLGSKSSIAEKFASTRSPHTPLLREVPANYTPKPRAPTAPSTEVDLNVFGEHFPTASPAALPHATTVFEFVDISEMNVTQNVPQSPQDILCGTMPGKASPVVEEAMSSPNSVRKEEAATSRLSEKTVVALLRELQSLESQFAEEYGESALMALNNR